MQRPNSDQTYATRRFWDKYIQYIIDQGVKESSTRWYVIRVEQYIKAFSEKRLADHRPEDVAIYFKEQGRQGKIKDWQFRQTVDAIQNLFTMLDTPWLSEVDWKYWMDSSSSLLLHQKSQKRT